MSESFFKRLGFNIKSGYIIATVVYKISTKRYNGAYSMLLSFFPTTAVFKYNDKQKTSSESNSEVREDRQWWYRGLNISMSPGRRATAIPCSAKVKKLQTSASIMYLSISFCSPRLEATVVRE